MNTGEKNDIPNLGMVKTRCQYCDKPAAPHNQIEGATVDCMDCVMEATRKIRERYQRRNRELAELQGRKIRLDE